MKLFISADIEGITGVTSWESTRYGGKGYEEACLQMTLETAAACRAAIAAGYEVVVKDGHEDAMNIDGNLLPRGTQLIRGWMNSPLGMMGGLDETYDGVLYIGYHAAAGTNESPLKHTSEDYLYNWVTVNGQPASEFTLNSAMADELGVPSLFLSGDKGICQEVEAAYPGIRTVAVKEGVGNATWNIHPQDAIERIEKTVAEILSKPLPKAKPAAKEYRLVMNCKEHQNARSASWYPGAELIDPFTVAYTAKSAREMNIARGFMVG